jgi:hypothetical protein
VQGLKVLAAGALGPGDRLLVAEACNHNRITDHCNDIGMVQIPAALERLCGGALRLEHAFGRRVPRRTSRAPAVLRARVPAARARVCVCVCVVQGRACTRLCGASASLTLCPALHAHSTHHTPHTTQGVPRAR